VKYEGRKAIVCLGVRICGTHLELPPRSSHPGNVKIRMISQGASEINLTFVIEENDAAEVVRRLHKAFFATSIRKCLHSGFHHRDAETPTRAQRSLFRVSCVLGVSAVYEFLMNLLILGRGKTGSMVAESRSRAAIMYEFFPPPKRERGRSYGRCSGKPTWSSTSRLRRRLSPMPKPVFAPIRTL